MTTWRVFFFVLNFLLVCCLGSQRFLKFNCNFTFIFVRYELLQLWPWTFCHTKTQKWHRPKSLINCCTGASSHWVLYRWQYTEHYCIAWYTLAIKGSMHSTSWNFFSSSLRQFPSGVATANHLPPSPYTSTSRLSSSSGPPACQLQPQNPSTNVFTVPPLDMSKLSQSGLSGPDSILTSASSFPRNAECN